MGLAFKENCPDLRNTRVVDLLAELAEFGVTVEVSDPHVDPEEALSLYGIDLVATPMASAYDGVILAVGHDEFRSLGAAAIRRLCKPDHVFFDLKSLFDPAESHLRL